MQAWEQPAQSPANPPWMWPHSSLFQHREVEEEHGSDALASPGCPLALYPGPVLVLCRVHTKERLGQEKSLEQVAHE